MKRAFALCFALPLLLCLTPRPGHAQSANSPFADVPVTDPAYDDVQAIQDAQVVLVVLGYPDSTIGSRVPMPRYEFAIAISRLAESVVPEPLGRKDADADMRQEVNAKLQSHPLALAALKRLVDEFQPELKGLGEDVPAIQAYLVALRPDLPPMPVSPPFADVPRDHWAFQAVENLRKAGIIRGETHERYQGE